MRIIHLAAERTSYLVFKLKVVSTIGSPKQFGENILISMCRFQLRSPYAAINAVPVRVNDKYFHSRLNPLNVRQYFIAIRRRRIFLQSIRFPLFCFYLFQNVLEHYCIKQSHAAVLRRQPPSSPYNAFYTIKNNTSFAHSSILPWFI